MSNKKRPDVPRPWQGHEPRCPVCPGQGWSGFVCRWLIKPPRSTLLGSQRCPCLLAAFITARGPTARAFVLSSPDREELNVSALFKQTGSRKLSFSARQGSQGSPRRYDRVDCAWCLRGGPLSPGYLSHSHDCSKPTVLHCQPLSTNKCHTEVAQGTPR